MKPLLIALLAALLILVAAIAVWMGMMPGGEGQAPGPASGPPEPHTGCTPLHVGLVPERDILGLRKRYLSLTAYLGKKLNRPVHVVTVNTYQAVLQDFADNEMDVAFLGSLVAVLAVDRLDARVLVKPLRTDGVSTYRGVVFVREGSPIRKVEDLAGRSIAMVRTTTAGELFPVYLLHQAGLLEGASRPRTVWVGTHDEVIRETLSGRVDAGAAKNLRLNAFLAAHPDTKIRRLATGDEVPNDALVIRADLAETLGEELKRVLLTMHEDPEGVEALSGFGAARFVPCDIGQFAAVYTMVNSLRGQWARLGIDWPPPKPPKPPPPAP